MNLIKPDFEKAYKKWCADFRWTDKLTDTVGKGLKKLMVVANDTNKINWDTLTPDSWVLVMNDFDLSATKEYYEHGITNVVLLSTIDTAEDDTVRQHVHNYIFNIVYKSPKFLKMLNTNGLPWKAILNLGNYPTAVFSGKKIKWQTKLQIKGDSEYMKKHFDNAIANPPYGKIGANAVKKVMDVIDYDSFINLLPMVDYEKADDKYPLWQHVDLTTIESCPGCFADAGISPLIANIKKAPANSLTAEEFRISCLENRLTQKYFIHNISRPNTFIITEQFFSTDLSKSIALPLRTKSGNHSGQANLGKSEKSQFYNINNGLKQTVTAEETKSICCTTVTFNTEVEKQNVAKLFYSDLGYRFTSWLMTGMNRDAFHLREHSMWFPRLDWTRTWTVEEILEEYGYTQEEIQAVLSELTTLKGIE